MDLLFLRVWIPMQETTLQLLQDQLNGFYLLLKILMNCGKYGACYPAIPKFVSKVCGVDVVLRAEFDFAIHLIRF